MNHAIAIERSSATFARPASKKFSQVPSAKENKGAKIRGKFLLLNVTKVMLHCNAGLKSSSYCHSRYDLFFAFIDWSLHLPCYPPKVFK